MSASFSLGFAQGLLNAGHCVPPGCHVVNLKICEGCGRSFCRSINGLKYCPVCCIHLCMPLLHPEYDGAAEEYRMRKYVRYDNSLFVVKNENQQL